MLAFAERLALKTLDKDYTRTEDDLKAVQSVGQIVAEILKQLDDERCGYALAATPVSNLI